MTFALIRYSSRGIIGEALTSSRVPVVIQVGATNDPVLKAHKLWKTGGAAAIFVADHKRLRGIKVVEVDTDIVRRQEVHNHAENTISSTPLLTEHTHGL